MPNNHFADSPNEIIAQLIDHLGFDDHSATHFALTCRRFWDAALPLKLKYQRDYLLQMVDEGALALTNMEHHDSPHPHESTKEGTTDRITPILSTNAACGAAIYPLRRSFVRDIWCLRGFIQKFTEKGCVFGLELRLDTLVYLLEAEEAGRVLSTFTKLPRLYLKVVGDLHAIGLDRSKPFRFTTWREQTLGLKFRTGMHVLAKLSARVNISLQGNPSIRPSVPSSTRVVTQRTARNIVLLSDTPCLLSLDISSPMLFLASFYPSTLNLLNKAPLTQLILHNCDLTTSDWSQLLRSLTLQHLETLLLICTTAAFSDFLIFLGRHPLIQCLTIAGSESNHSDSVMGLSVQPRAFLPKLQTIVAGPYHLLYFLNHIKTFTQLKRIVLYGGPPASCGSPSQYHGFSPVFNKLSQIQIKGRSLELVLISLRHSGLFSWFLGSNVTGFKGNGKNILCVQALTVFHDGFQFFDDTRVILKAYSHGVARVGDHGDTTSASRDFGGPLLLIIEALIEIFPNLEKVAFPGAGRGEDH